MSLRGSALRVLLAALLFGLIVLGDKLGRHGDDFAEDHPAGIFFGVLNEIFKKTGWLLTASCWALLLAARYNRQIRLQENASWRRHAVVDTSLWILGTIYWITIVHVVFKKVAFNVGDCVLPEGGLVHAEMTSIDCAKMKGNWVPFDISGHAFLGSLGISILLEEIIRFIGEPVYYFTFYSTDGLVNRAKLFWRVAVIFAICLVSIWLILFARTALFYHTFQEKIWGTIVGLAYWWAIVIIRLFILYI
jgi:hypothetical protein